MSVSRRFHPRSLWVLLLAASLLLAQSVALGHVHKDALGAHDNCGLCQYAQHHGGLAPTSLPDRPVRMVHVIAQLRVYAGCELDHCIHCYQSRAPPELL